MVIKIRDERHLRSLTGLSQKQFDELLVIFINDFPPAKKG